MTIFSAILPVVKKDLNAKTILNLDLILIKNFNNTGEPKNVLKAVFIDKNGKEKTEKTAQAGDEKTLLFFEKITQALPPNSEFISIHIKQDEKGRAVFLNYKQGEEMKREEL